MQLSNKCSRKYGMLTYVVEKLEFIAKNMRIPFKGSLRYDLLLIYQQMIWFCSFTQNAPQLRGAS
jgi:hypothetical protein